MCFFQFDNNNIYYAFVTLANREMHCFKSKQFILSGQRIELCSHIESVLHLQTFLCSQFAIFIFSMTIAALLVFFHIFLISANSNCILFIYIEE